MEDFLHKLGYEVHLNEQGLKLLGENGAKKLGLLVDATNEVTKAEKELTEIDKRRQTELSWIADAVQNASNKEVQTAQNAHNIKMSLPICLGHTKLFSHSSVQIISNIHSFLGGICWRWRFFSL